MSSVRFVLFLIIWLTAAESRASHVMGGEITWTCQGGQYVFELIFYRDCNGAEVNTISETINVWNHPSISSIPVAFVARVDMSPFCNPVTGSPPQLACGTGNQGGNGVGAIEKIIYRSLPITLPGTAPANGWIFTAQNFSRSNAITNITNPSNYGITISAYMFPIPGGGTGCVDSSPKFLQEPYLVSCAGTPYVYNMNAIDPDLDSISVTFGSPLNNFATGTFDPPSNPILVPYETGFSANSPTPDATFNPGNVAANIDLSSGELKFTSFTTGNFVVKLIVRSFRQGVLIAQVEREMQLVVMNCLPNNNPPVVNGPFGGLFETTVTGGDLVTFNLSSTDIELLQDGSPQNNILTASGPMFGTNFTSNTGCDIAPCATLNATPAITGTQGVTTNFSWQTSCDHLVNQYGIVAEMVPYHFVFKIQDNYCQVPKVTYATVTINVRNPGVIQPPQINCIQTLPNGNLTINWTPVNDPENSFVAYEIHSVETGLIATINNVGAGSFNVPAINDNHAFFIRVISGCGGNTSLSSDTVSNIFLELFNPNDGTAILQWNEPVSSPGSNLGAYYHIMREYPAGTWTLIDSVAYGTQSFKDTIDICQAFLNYRIILPGDICDFTSNIIGDDFKDMMTPGIPVLGTVTIDTLTGLVTITWDTNKQPDTYGYVVYMADGDGILFEVDTVWGINNTSYTFGPNTADGPLTFSVAAFDSCFTTSVPPTYQTSAKGEIHSSIFTSYAYNVCDQVATIQWTPYVGWNNLSGYTVYGRIAGGSWTDFGTTLQTNLPIPVNALEAYEFVVRGSNTSGLEAFSNIISVTAVAPSEPDFSYTRVATVEGNKEIKIKHYVDAVGGVSALSLEKRNDNGVFVPYAQAPVNSNNIEFTDDEVSVHRKSYAYRVRIIDSCGKPGSVSNEVETILLNIQTDDLRMKNYLSWSEYIGFNGSIINYSIYREIDGIPDYSPIATVSGSTLYFEDDLYEQPDLTGKICYYVEAVESMNIYAFSEISRSNQVCAVFEPLIYVPNAFTPGGVNPVFKPVVSLVDPNDYQFTIIDRWGQIIYQTNNVTDGWDGTIASQKAPIGTYMYVLQVKDGNGQEVVKRGHVSLLR